LFSFNERSKALRKKQTNQRVIFFNFQPSGALFIFLFLPFSPHFGRRKENEAVKNTNPDLA